MSSNNLLYQIALTKVPNIGCVKAKQLLQYFNNDAAQIFKASIKDICAIEGFGDIAAKSIKYFDDFAIAENEIKFIEKNNIQTLFYGDSNYPNRLLNIYDSPTMLYYKGNADLNTSKVIAVIGTRNNTDYGKKITEKLVDELSVFNILIVSGLAFGIDIIAHKAALKKNLSTVGVLAHGLDSLYPPEHKKYASQMVAENGGLLSEFMSTTKPDRHNFPTRNRIVAALSDATVVIETDVKGGSIITAELANGYNKDVFVFPGKTTDPKSAGCNLLIKNNKANLITSAADIIEQLGWEQKTKKPKKQRELFVEFTANEKNIVSTLNEKNILHIDELSSITNLTNSEIASALLSLELQAVIQNLPGKRIQLL